jgi:serine/threonine protein kinase
MDLHYALYCFADPNFYDSLERWDDAGSRFAVTSRLAPPGWSRFEQGVWIAVHPHDVDLPPQGWKIHISARLDDAEDVLRIVWDYCVARKVVFKFLRSRDILLVINSKHADRASSGKLLTLYPVGDAELHRTLRDLAAALEGYQGPYILSDLRWGSGPLYVRYGAFLERYCQSETGDLAHAIETPDGRLVPDVRQPLFQVPPWVDVPDFIAAQMAVGEVDPPEDFPYQIERPLQFSNAGGVYLARDTRTGQRVVLKEARPFAGLDADGADAVARLKRERGILEQLGDLDVVPNLLGYLTCWEHHFLVEEYLEGDLLDRCINRSYPLGQLEPTREEIVGYTEWALDVLGRIERGLDGLHRRGIVFGDLHPLNIIVRPDGRIAFVDFEVASRIDEHRHPGLGAPGFVAPPSCSGTDIDRYALDCMRLWMFFRLTFLLHRDTTKAETLVRALTERFPVPKTFAAQLLQGLRRDADHQDARSSTVAQQSATSPAVLLAADVPDWDALRASMIEAILESATPERTDRLFPGDIAQFRYGGLNLAHGAAGVLYALTTTGAGSYPEHVDWLIRASRQARQPYAGLYNGLHGVAYVLDHLGYRNEALATLDRALVLSAGVRAHGLFAGQAGIALSLLHFAETSAEQSFHDAALRFADQLAGAAHDPATVPDRPSSAGLMYGFSGAALLFVRLYDETTDEGFLDLAATALRRDLAYCEVTRHGGLEVREGGRHLPFLGTGSAGIGLVLHEYLYHRHDEEFISAQARISRACQSEFVIQSGLFNGRAGLIAYLNHISDTVQEPRRDAALELHLRRLIWHALPYQGRVGFAGDQMLRLSMDLATGSAGVLLALHAVLDQAEVFLPFLRCRQPAVHQRTATM